MKHIFVINPAAGKANATTTLLPRLQTLFAGREEELETYLCRSPFVAEAVVVGVENEKKKDLDVVALIYPDRSHFEEVYGKQFTDLQVNTELNRAVETVNDQVQSYKRIVRFVRVAQEFPKSASRKIKRMGLEALAGQ